MLVINIPPLFYHPSSMKLSEHLIALERAFTALLSSIDHLDSNPRSPYNQRRVRTDIPRLREKYTVPTIPTQFKPLTHSSSTENQLLPIKLAAFEATYHDSLTPISPDMVPLVIDTGASITVTPYITNFIGPIKPIQAIEIKGIASGLQVPPFIMMQEIYKLSLYPTVYTSLNVQHVYYALVR
jgi:hypothetical protein